MHKINRLCERFGSYLFSQNLDRASIRSHLATVREFLCFCQKTLGWNEQESLSCYHFQGYFLFQYQLAEEQPSCLEKKIRILGAWQRSLGENLPDHAPFRGKTPALEEMRKLYLLPMGDKPLEIRNKLIITLILCYGLSTTELLRIKCKHLDLEKRLLTLNQNLHLESRTLPLIPEAAICFQRYLEAIAPDSQLLVNNKGQELSWAGLRHVLKQKSREAGIPNYCPKELRRGWLKHLASSTPLPKVLYYSGYRPGQIATLDRELLARWHLKLTDGHPFFGELNGEFPTSTT